LVDEEFVMETCGGRLVETGPPYIKIFREKFRLVVMIALSTSIIYLSLSEKEGASKRDFYWKGGGMKLTQ
jgi:hypothetical protein